MRPNIVIQYQLGYLPISFEENIMQSVLRNDSLAIQKLSMNVSKDLRCCKQFLRMFCTFMSKLHMFCFNYMQALALRSIPISKRSDSNLNVRCQYHAGALHVKVSMDTKLPFALKLTP